MKLLLTSDDWLEEAIKYIPSFCKNPPRFFRKNDQVELKLFYQIPDPNVKLIYFWKKWSEFWEWVVVEVVGDLSWVLPEGSLFNSYYTKV